MAGSISPNKIRNLDIRFGAYARRFWDPGKQLIIRDDFKTYLVYLYIYLL